MAPIDAESLTTYFFLMPKISLVVCLYREKELLERLLQHAQGCYDDLVVVHDGPEYERAGWELTQGPGAGAPLRDSTSKSDVKVLQAHEVRYADGWRCPEDFSLTKPDVPPAELAIDYAALDPTAPIPTGYRLRVGTPQRETIHEAVTSHGGRMFEGPRCFQQEAHWPFAWWAAKHAWILRLDADEFPSDKLRDWLRGFRRTFDADESPKGYSCIWPLWNGHRAVTSCWPSGRLFLFDKSCARLFSMPEQSPILREAAAPISLRLEHQPLRKSFGCSNLLTRSNAGVWRKIIARSLQASPQHLPRWRWGFGGWPLNWAQLARQPLFYAFSRVFVSPLRQLLYVLKIRGEIVFTAFLGTGLHQALMALTYLREKARR
jgi:hypothetical protein